MAKNKLIILVVAMASVSLAFLSGCGSGSDKSKIAETMRVRVESGLAEGETFGFVGLSNRRDTVFMGATHSCAGVIYTITGNVSGDKTRHFADVIFSDDYKTVLWIKELDFDPIEFVEEKVKEKFKAKIMEKSEK